MKQQTEMANEERAKQALEQGSSALPTPIGHSADIGDLTNNDGKNDPLKELEAEVERQKQQITQVQQQQTQPQQPQQPKAVEQFDDSLAQAIQRQMGQLMEGWTPRGLKQLTVTKVKEAETTTPKTSTIGANAKNATPAPTATLPLSKIIVPAGTVSYAQLLTEANSDVPGPILAQIVSGPLAGARAVGQFLVANGYNDYLVLQFNVADLKGRDYTINAIALDPDTTLGGMATEVDQRYLTRVILPAAAGFLQGFGGALGTGNSSIATNGSTTIVTQSGHSFEQGLYTGMGMFFISSVTDQTLQEQQQQNPSGIGLPQLGAGGYGTGGYPGYGTPGSPNQSAGYYPGTTMPGYGMAGQTPGYGNVPYPNYASTGSGYGTGLSYPGYLGSGSAGIIQNGSPYNLPIYGH
jgi:hypothetical protein